MTTVRLALAAAVLLLLPAPLVVRTTEYVASLEPGVSIDLWMRIVITASNGYVRFWLPAAFVVLGGIGFVGLSFEKPGFAEQRRALTWWIVIAVSGAILELGIGRPTTPMGWVRLAVLSGMMASLAIVAAVVVASRLQAAIARSHETRLRAWHVATLGTALLLVAGLPALLLPAWVLLASHRASGVDGVERGAKG